MLKHWPQCPSPAVSITTNSLVRPSPPRLQCLDSTSTAIVQGPVTCHRTANPLMGPKYNDFNNENATQVRGIVLSGIMIMTKHDQLVRVSINSPKQYYAEGSNTRCFSEYPTAKCG